jgi:hypothetical protein
MLVHNKTTGCKLFVSKKICKKQNRLEKIFIQNCKALVENTKEAMRTQLISLWILQLLRAISAGLLISVPIINQLSAV